MQYDKDTQMTNTTIVLKSSATLEYNNSDGTGVMIPEGCTIYCTNPKNNVVAKGLIKIDGKLYADFRGQTTQGKDLSTGLGAIKETKPEEKRNQSLLLRTSHSVLTPMYTSTVLSVPSISMLNQAPMYTQRATSSTMMPMATLPSTVISG